MKIIKFCENNFSQGTEEIAKKLENEHDDVTVEIEPCLGHCGECSEGPFALVDDEFIQEETAELLYEKIMEEL